MQESKCKVIAITYQKGGVGKATTTFNLEVVWAKQGKRVLVVDVDSQSNLTTYAGLYDENENANESFVREAKEKLGIDVSKKYL